jgi:hypothetical protein
MAGVSRAWAGARLRGAVAAVIAVGGGIALAFMDSRPGFDDTGITAVALFVFASIASTIGGSKPWLWASLVGAWTPLIEISGGGSTGSLLALAFAGAGAAAGYLVARGLRSR